MYSGYQGKLPSYYQQFTASDFSGGAFTHETPTLWGIPQITRPAVKDQPLRLQYSPTAKIDHYASVYDDAMRLKDAFASSDPHKTLNEILPHRSPEHIAKVVQEYDRITRKSLWKRCTEIFDSYNYTITLLVSSPQGMRAWILRYAFDKWNQVDYDSIIYIFVTHTEEEIDMIEREYQREYKKTVVEQIRSKSQGFLQRALLAVVDKKTMFDITPEDLSRQIRVFTTPGQITDGMKDHMITMILKSHYVVVRKLIFEYERLTGSSLEERFSATDPFERCLRAMVCYVSDPARYFALHMYEGLQKRKPQKVCNVVCLHYMSDMGHIAHAYDQIFPTPLVSEIESSLTTSDFSQDVLLRLLGRR